MYFSVFEELCCFRLLPWCKCWNLWSSVLPWKKSSSLLQTEWKSCIFGWKVACLCCLLCSVCVRAAHEVCRQSSFLVRTFKGAGHVACEFRAAARIIKRDVVWMQSRGPVSKAASCQCDVLLGSLASPSHSSHFKVLWLSMGATCSSLVPQSPPFLQRPQSKSPRVITFLVVASQAAGSAPSSSFPPSPHHPRRIGRGHHRQVHHLVWCFLNRVPRYSPPTRPWRGAAVMRRQRKGSTD